MKTWSALEARLEDLRERDGRAAGGLYALCRGEVEYLVEQLRSSPRKVAVHDQRPAVADEVAQASTRGAGERRRQITGLELGDQRHRAALEGSVPVGGTRAREGMRPVPLLSESSLHREALDSGATRQKTPR